MSGNLSGWPHAFPDINAAPLPDDAHTLTCTFVTSSYSNLHLVKHQHTTNVIQSSIATWILSIGQIS